MKHLIEGNKKENNDIRVNKEEKIKNKLQMNGIKKESKTWQKLRDLTGNVHII
jgi:hypothetical protein